MYKILMNDLTSTVKHKNQSVVIASAHVDDLLWNGVLLFSVLPSLLLPPVLYLQSSKICTTPIILLLQIIHPPPESCLLFWVNLILLPTYELCTGAKVNTAPTHNASGQLCNAIKRGSRIISWPTPCLIQPLKQKLQLLLFYYSNSSCCSNFTCTWHINSNHWSN